MLKKKPKTFESITSSLHAMVKELQDFAAEKLAEADVDRITAEELTMGANAKEAEAGKAEASATRLKELLG